MHVQVDRQSNTGIEEVELGAKRVMQLSLLVVDGVGFRKRRVMVNNPLKNSTVGMGLDKT